MEVVIMQGSRLAGLAADAVETLVQRRPDAVLGLATGSSPLGVYDELASRCATGNLSLRRARAFLLDEYVGLPPEHPCAYRQVIEQELVRRVDIDPAAVLGPHGGREDLGAACQDYEHAIREAGGIDVQLLGIGTDGHIAFNEPGSSLGSRTRIKTLTARTRQDNSRFFPSLGQVPRHVLTQGLATIGEARHLVLLATGLAKADAVAAAVEGPVSARCPASVLQLHPHATILLDEPAASRLELASYYRECFEGKPSWQGL